MREWRSSPERLPRRSACSSIPPPGRKVLVFNLVNDLFLQTDGSTSDRNVEIEAPQLSGLGPYVESFRCVTKTENRTMNHTWNAGLQWSFDGKTWRPTAGPGALFSKVSANDQVIQAAFSTETSFAAPHLRLVLMAANSSGTERESASVGLVLIVTLKS